MATERDFLDYVFQMATPSAVAALGWWLRSQFSKVIESATRQLNDHERIDQERHEQNLQRFEEINVALGRLNPDNPPPSRFPRQWRP